MASETGEPKSPPSDTTNVNNLSFVTALLNEVLYSPLNLCLTLICIYLVYKLLRKPKNEEDEGERFKLPDPLPQQDMTLEKLRKYDGTGEDKRICIAVNGEIYDCTKGRQFYGPGGPYSKFAGHDATRALANFDVSAVKDVWDDTSDLTASEMSSVQEWQEQFKERYEYVGRLVKELSEEDADAGVERKAETAEHSKSD